MKKQHAWILASFLLFWVLSSCRVETAAPPDSATPANGDQTATEEPAPVQNTAVPAAPSPDPRTNRLTPEATPVIEAVPETAVPEITGEVPEAIMTAVLADLTSTAGVEPEAIAVLEASAVIWNDGSLGCPQPGQVYTQATVAGYRIILEANGRRYSYHAAASGTYILCPSGLPAPPPVAGTPAS